MSDRILKRLEEVAGAGCVRVQEPMAPHTTFRIGGPADYYVTPVTAAQITGVLRLCREENLPLTVIGNGSNLLVGDAGIRGVVLALGGMTPSGDPAERGDRGSGPELTGIYDIRVTGELLRAGAGVMLSTLALRAAREGLAGLAFAGGIPGTLGGGILMNAGAYGGELKDCLKQVWLCDREGDMYSVPAEELELGYRTSRMQTSGEIVVAAEFELQPGDPEQILAEIQELNARRREKQPLEYPSAGSTFKRPEGYFAGKLIQDAGLRGFRVGDAQVSEKHCGFVINRGGATADQVLELIRQVQARVQQEYGVWLEPEVRIIG